MGRKRNGRIFYDRRRGQSRGQDMTLVTTPEYSQPSSCLHDTHDPILQAAERANMCRRPHCTLDFVELVRSCERNIWAGNVTQEYKCPLVHLFRIDREEMTCACFLPGLEATTLESRWTHTTKVLLLLFLFCLDFLPLRRGKAVRDIGHLERCRAACSGKRSKRCRRRREGRGRILSQSGDRYREHRTHDTRSYIHQEL